MNRMALMNKRCSEVMKDLRMQQPGNSTIAVEGHTDPQFAQVLKAFITNFEQGREIGAAVTVYHRGKLVIDLAGGLRDHVSGEPYSRETLQPVFSATKEITALAANMLADRGQLDLDAPVQKSRRYGRNRPIAFANLSCLGEKVRETAFGNLALPNHSLFQQLLSAALELPCEFSQKFQRLLR